MLFRSVLRGPEQHAPDPFSNASGEMEQSYFREQADRCRRLAHDSTDPVLQVSLRRLADEYQMRADEIENDEISAKRADPND
jgi:hypothetical protein